ncbi:MAG: hypothetical protein JW837_13750 [Sedimentisphaerales bacterium]|nr:hypothetical protein [Sedimentisphaerales bacterium]
MNNKRFDFVISLSIFLLLCGCVNTIRPKKLEDVAKDWCMTIRASQIVPVYPLTEDLQPGDVFLVQIPIQKQDELYKDRGFLPLDQLMVRLEPLDFNDLYFNSYFKPYYSGQPLDRPEPNLTSQGWRFKKAPLPMAAFPSYTFNVDNSSGLKIALPVKGIPVGMGLMNAASASGSITISDGMTYAIDTLQVLSRLHEWYDETPGASEMMQELNFTAKGHLYLRVITRVYMVGAVDISLSRTKTGGSGLDAGQAPNIHLVNLKATDANEAAAKAKAYQEILDELSKPMEGAVPGGGLRIAWASGNSVMLKEKFPRLLAIGYLGFDVPILEDGSLGPIIATRDHIDPNTDFRPMLRPETRSIAPITIMNLYRTLSKTDSSTKEKELAKSMDSLIDLFILPEDVTFYKLSLDPQSRKIDIAPRGNRGAYDNTKLEGFERLNALYGTMETSIKAIKKTIQNKSGDQRQRFQEELNRQEKLLKILEQTINQNPAVRKALKLKFGDALYNYK